MHYKFNEAMFIFDVYEIDNFVLLHVYIAVYKSCFKIIMSRETKGNVFNQSSPLLPPLIANQNCAKCNRTEYNVSSASKAEAESQVKIAFIENLF